MKKTILGLVLTMSLASAGNDAMCRLAAGIMTDSLDKYIISAKNGLDVQYQKSWVKSNIIDVIVYCKDVRPDYAEGAKSLLETLKK